MFLSPSLRHRRGVLLAVLYSAVTPSLLFTPTTAATVDSCGTTITEDSVLDEDLSCDCDEIPTTIDGTTYESALVLDSARLDMNGYTLSCGDTGSIGISIGILIIGEGATLQDGTVKETGGDCVKVFGNRHFIHRMLIEDCDLDGIEVEGDENRLVQVEVVNVNDDGINVDGDYNQVTNSIVKITGETGIEVDGSYNKIINCYVENADDEGIEVNDGGSGGLNIEIINNVVVNTKNDGIDVRSGTEGAIIRANTVSGSGDNGIEVQGDDHIITANTVSESDGHGIRVSGDDHIITANKSFNNNEDGIRLTDSADGCVLRGNKAYDNNIDDDGYVDLSDENGDCLSNDWKGNKGDDKDPVCIK